MSLTSLQQILQPPPSKIPDDYTDSEIADTGSTDERTVIPEDKFPSTYTSNTEREKMILLYVQNFQRQFHALYFDRKIPFMVCENEVGVKKMVCTFIQPTVLKYEEISNWKSCAEFIADCLVYVPLKTPAEPPQSLDSPNTVFKHRKGNCFEYSILLCSLLLGLGYDAYVVNGYATQDICMLILEREDSPIIKKSHEVTIGLYSSVSKLTRWLRDLEEHKLQINEAEVIEEKVTKKYIIKPLKEEYKSKFEEKMEKKRLSEERKLFEMEKEEEYKKEMAAQCPPPDELAGKRVHSWVLVKSGKREVPKDFFIEPTKGWKISLSNPNYLAVESVWNNNNFSVNMQDSNIGSKRIVYNLHDEGLWESFMPYIEVDFHGKIKRGFRDDEELSAIEQEHMDIPLSWARPIVISAKDLQNRFPNGKKIELYKYKKVEKFNPYLMKDGLTLRICHYKTWDRKELQLIEEYFQQRTDQLYYKVHNLNTGLITEYFKSGQPNALKEHTFQANDTSLQSNRTLMFYHNRRADGLSIREVKIEEIADRYVGRLDFLIYRHTWFGVRIKKFGSLESTRRQILKIHEKYTKDLSKSTDDVGIAEIIYNLGEGKIKVIYHRRNGKIASSWREFIKPPETEEHRDFHKDFSLDSMKEFRADPEERQITRLEAYLMLLDLMKTEMQAINRVREDENELIAVLTEKMHEDHSATLYYSPYNVMQIESTREARLKKEQEELEERLSQEKDQDYLLPYLLKFDIQPSQSLTQKQIQTITEMCLTDMKNQLMERFNYIQARYEEVTKEMQDLENWHQLHHLGLKLKEEQEYQQKHKNILFKLQVIELRLTQHKEAAPQKYLELEKKLRNDPRLNFSL